jgi:hypothetical protein
MSGPNEIDIEGIARADMFMSLAIIQRLIEKGILEPEEHNAIIDIAISMSGGVMKSEVDKVLRMLKNPAPLKMGPVP